MPNAYIRGTGMYVPENVVTNQDLVDNYGIDTTNEWIIQRTGIEERRYAEEGVATSDLALKATEQALERAGMDKDEIDMILHYMDHLNVEMSELTGGDPTGDAAEAPADAGDANVQKVQLVAAELRQLAQLTIEASRDIHRHLTGEVWRQCDALWRPWLRNCRCEGLRGRIKRQRIMRTQTCHGIEE